MTFWNRRATKLGKHRHLPEDILDDETGSGTGSALEWILHGEEEPHIAYPGNDLPRGRLYIKHDQGVGGGRLYIYTNGFWQEIAMID